MTRVPAPIPALVLGGHNYDWLRIRQTVCQDCALTATFGSCDAVGVTQRATGVTVRTVMRWMVNTTGVNRNFRGVLNMAG
jgi:hypothetical protein